VGVEDPAGCLVSAVTVTITLSAQDRTLLVNC
jgi:hypothetical protein